MIYSNEADDARMTDTEQEELIAAHNRFGETFHSAIRGGEALHPTRSATTVRVRGNHVLTVDGPFAETKEQLGGFYIVECDNLDDAIAIAAKLPGVEKGSIEVRPIMEFS
jgi:hypothetical protein